MQYIMCNTSIYIIYTIVYILYSYIQFNLCGPRMKKKMGIPTETVQQVNHGRWRLDSKEGVVIAQGMNRVQDF